MGVRFLHTYTTTNVSDGYLEVNIKEEIEKYKRKHDNQEPLIVIDLLAMNTLFYTNNHELILGGRYNIYIARVKHVLGRLKSLGARLVFFTDGPTRNEKIPTNLLRRNGNYTKAIKALEIVYSSVDLNTDMQDIEVQAPVPFFNSLKTIASEFGDVYITVLNECDLELAEYATRNNALAVISNDTDFLIFEGNWKFWTSNHIDIEHLRTKEYNREALRNTLGLMPDQMPILATMSGNDILQYDSIKDFHNRIKRSNLKNRHYRPSNTFRLIASEIQNMRLRGNSNRHETAKCISKLIFPNSRQESWIQLIETSLNSYDYTKLNRSHGSEILELTAQADGRMNYIILADIKYIIQLHHFDLSKSDLMPYFEIIRPLFTRQMGILLKNDPTQTARTFYCKLSAERDYEEIVLTPTFPSCEVPPLNNLLRLEKGEDPQLDKIRLELLCWEISSKLTPEIIKSVPSEHVAMSVTLFYLMELKQINLDEADCLLLACNCPDNIRDSLKLCDVRCINERDARINFLFTSVQIYIKNCFYAVGLKEYCTLLAFDSLYFHTLRQKWSTIDKAEMLNDFDALRIYAR